MLSYAYQWIGLLWMPIAFIVARRGHRAMAALLALACMLTLAAQTQIMGGHDHGLLQWLPYTAYIRGMCVYSLGLIIFLGIAWASPGALPSVFITAAILFYFMMFAVAMLVMVV